MNTISALPSYSDIADVLANAKSNFSPSQVHGLFCGYICGKGDKIDHQWEKLVLGKNSNLEARELLLQLYEISYHQMSEFSFEFTLILPDDETDINIRTEALGLWCQGFLSGLEQCDIPLKNREPSDVTETLNDLVEIAQVNYGDIASDDEDENAYFELAEYVRLSTLLVFHDLKAVNPREENNLLH